jgi:hypothetical protein
MRLAWILALSLGLSCAGPAQLRGEGLDVNQLPAMVRDDYALFAQRCSKCHALSRALNSGIDDDEFWNRYVTRMRLQPASGISPEDEVGILRFLHYYAGELRRRKAPPAQGRADAPRGEL